MRPSTVNRAGGQKSLQLREPKADFAAGASLCAPRHGASEPVRCETIRVAKLARPVPPRDARLLESCRFFDSGVGNPPDLVLNRSRCLLDAREHASVVIFAFLSRSGGLPTRAPRFLQQAQRSRALVLGAGGTCLSTRRRKVVGM